jgi:hypothetical protein
MERSISSIIAPTLEHIEFMVQTLQVACVDRVIELIQQTVPRARQGLGKVPESLDAAGLDPIARETQGFATIPAIP